MTDTNGNGLELSMESLGQTDETKNDAADVSAEERQRDKVV